jgi:hypothetical protein
MHQSPCAYPGKASHFARLPRCAIAFLALLSLSATNRLPAADTLRDHELTCRARQVLFKDPALAGLNVGVTVRSGIASLWGAVPSAEIGRQACERVRQVQGVLEVHSELRVESPDDPLTQFLATPRPPARTPPQEWVAESLRLPALLTGRFGDWQAPPENSPVPNPAGNEPGVALLSPILVPAPPAAVPGILAQTIDRLRQADKRFRGIRTDVQGGVVRLRGVIGRGEDLMDLAQMISRLPGVERVILEDVSAMPR